MKTKLNIGDEEHQRIQCSIETHHGCTGEEERQQNLYEPRVIAQLFGFDGPRRIEQLTRDGILDAVLVKVGGREVRRYDLVPTIQKYIRHLKEKARVKGVRTEKEMELREQKLEADVALKESQGELHRLKTQIVAGEYISVEEVRLDYAKFFAVFKKFAMSMPARMGGMLSGQIEPLQVRRIEKEMSSEITGLLNSFVVAGVVKPTEAKGILDVEAKKVAEEISGQ